MPVHQEQGVIPKHNRIDFIDLLEFVAMSFVLIYHCTTYSFDVIASPGPGVSFNYFFRAFLSVGVPLFFFANGYLLLNRELIMKKHLIKTLRLAGITIIWSLIFVVFLMLKEHQDLSVKKILLSLLTSKNGGLNQFWFLGALICIHLVFPVLKSCYDTNRKAFVFLAVLCGVMTIGNKLICGVGTVAAHELIGYPEQIRENVFFIFNPFQGVYWWYALAYFCCGGLAIDAVPYIRAHQRKMNVFAVCVLLSSALLLSLWGRYLSRLEGSVWDHVWGGYDTVFTFLMAASWFVLSQNYHPKREKTRKLIEAVSRNTLGIYLIHEIYVYLTIYRVRELAFARNVIGSIVLAAGIMLASLLSVYLIKKIPVLNKLLLV